MRHRLPEPLPHLALVLLATVGLLAAPSPGLAAPPWSPPGDATGGTTATIDGPAAAGPSDPAGWTTSVPTPTPITFSMLGAHLPHGAAVEVRTAADGAGWTDWTPLERLDAGPDPAAAEPSAAAATEPLWVGEATHVQVRTAGADPGDVELTLIDSRTPATAGRRAADVTPAATEPVGPPGTVFRSGWGADESLRNGDARYADELHFGVVHHTATANDYSRDEAAAVVRGIYRYHTESLGWDDIGYNLLVDRFGTVYEGRAGGLNGAVIGAHARGFNTGSFGISIVGTFGEEAPPPAALDAVAAAIGWKLAVHGIDGAGTVRVTSGGSPRYAAGTEVELDTLIGHRDVGVTACPGGALYARLDDLRAAATTIAVDLGGEVPAPLVVGDEPDGADGDGTDGDGTGGGTGGGDPAPAPEPVVGEPEPVPFTDIDATVHRRSIETVYRRHLTTGCEKTRYCPGEPVTRGQAATFLARSFDLPGAIEVPFSDVTADSVHAEGIAAIAAAGVTEGYGDGTFRPWETLTRQHMAVMLHRALGLGPVWGEVFVDVPFRPAWPRARVNAIAEAGITEGCGDGRFCPRDLVTRAQMATFLARALELTGPVG